MATRKKRIFEKEQSEAEEIVAQSIVNEDNVEEVKIKEHKKSTKVVKKQSKPSTLANFLF